MNNLFTSLKSVSVAGLILFVGMSCSIPSGPDIGSSGDGGTSVPVSSVALDKTTAGVVVGETTTLTATVSPADADNQIVAWSSNDESVATVDGGVVSGVAAGTTVIRAASAEDSGLYDECSITVTSSAVSVTGVSLDSSTLSIEKGNNASLAVSLEPADATNSDVTWSSSDESVATVSGGTVTAVGGGSATITVTTDDGGYTATCNVSVTIPVSSVALDKTTADVVVGETTTLTATVSPADADNQIVAWSSNDESVATVDGGVVSGVAAGTTVIRAASAEDSGLYDECSITVTSSAVSVTGVSLDSSTLSIEKGNNASLAVSLEPADATNSDVTWSSSDESVATVSGGTVTAVGGGSATITVTTDDGGYTATCNVSVTIPVSSVALDKTTAGVVVGETTTLTATVSPADADNQIVAWSSNDESVATVDGGVVSGVAAGTTVIRAASAEDSGLYDECSITVTSSAVSVTGVSLDSSTLSIEKGNNASLAVSLEPADATNSDVTWSSSDESVATVSGGTVTAVGGGSATITVTTDDGGYTATCNVSVTIPVSSVALDKTTADVVVGETTTLTATVSPADADNQIVAWSSNDESVATVDGGVVSGVAAGTTVIRAASAEDSGLYDECSITVTSSAVSVTGVSLDSSTLSIEKGNNASLAVSLEPADATNSDVTWSSSDESVATVSGGTVTAVGGGSATITVTTDDGGYTATCNVSVTIPVSSVALDKTTAGVVVGETTTLTATVSPADADNQIVAWSSNDESVATVDGGVVSGVAAGTTVIRAASAEDSGLYDECSITVTSSAVSVTGVSLDSSTLSIEKGNNASLAVSLEPADATNSDVTWSSSDESVATVSGGTVTAVGGGSATITVTTDDGGYTATCNVSVTIPVSSVALDKTTADVVVGETTTLTATVSPADADNQIVAWSSNDESVATVDGGVVSGVAAGTTVIRAASAEDSGLYDECSITVTSSAVSVTGVSLDSSTLSIEKGNNASLAVSLEPADATNSDVTWSSSDESVATVSGGTVTAVGGGSATITVTTDDGGYTATCNVSVTIPVSSVALDKTTADVVVGETTTLTATVSPADADNQIVAWSSNDESVATVDGGVVSGVAAGTTVIRAASAEDSGLYDECSITVTSSAVSVTGVSLDSSTLSIEKGNNASLAVSLEPADATNSDVTWSSSDESVATVSGGTVTAVGGGSATITVTTDDGGYTATCNVSVTIPVSSVALDKTTAGVVVGETTTLTATVSPADADNQIVAWSSNDESVATVDGGVVSGVAAGTTVIRAASAEDSGLYDECSITVTSSAVSVTGVSLDSSTLSIEKGNNASLAVSLEPADATNSDVTWSSSDESVATVSGGTVTAVGGGSATITVTTDDGGYTATCNVSVTIPVSSVALDKTTADVVVGETTTLTATVSPADADNQIVAWSSNDESVATVDGGVVSGVAAGTTVIRAASAEDSGLYDECSITVTSSAVSVTGVSLDSSTLSIEKGNNASLAVSLEPADATNSDVTWSSSDESVATVSGGTVTAVGGGSATITVTTDDGGYTATCNVSVTIPVSSVALDKTTAGVVVGETTTLTATVSPADADNQIVAWSSNDESVATVDGGVVSGVAAGTTVIRAASAEDSGLYDECSITVTSSAVSVTGVSLDSSTLSIEKGNNASLAVSLEPADATNSDVTWSSSDESVATVSGGTVTAVGGGSATITVTTDDGGYTATCNVSVTIPVSSVALDKTTADVVVGETTTLTATVSPADADNQIVAWSSNDESVATVDGGVVSGVAAGTTVIRAASAEDSGLYDECSITVTSSAVSVTGVSLDSSTLSIEKGNNASLAVSLEPADATNSDVTWSSSDESVATVSGGTVTAVGGGSATITVTTDDGGYTATCNVSVTIPVSSVALDKTTAGVVVGETTTLTATVSPADADNQIVAWSSNDESVATVDGGVVSGVAAGTTVIRAASAEDSGLYDECSITVTSSAVSVTGVSLDSSTLSIEKGNNASLAVSLEPADATNSDVTWSSSDESVATVSGGTVTAVGGGSATITVTTDDGGYTATCNVSVTIPVSSVALDKTTAGVVVGETTTLTATVSPADADNQIVAWSSNDESVATVDGGVVSGVAAGTTVIRAASAEDSGLYDECSITVTSSAVSVTGVSLDSSTLSIEKGNNASLAVSLEPADATNSDVTWSSSDESVATVSGGTVTAVGGGSATITVTTDDGGYTATCNVSVTIPVSSVALDKTTAGVVVGETTTLTATVSPADADNQIVAWSSNDESVATVDGGVVSGVAAGTTVIRAASAEDSGLYDECSITVTSSAVSVTGVSLDSSTLSIEKGNNASLAVSLEPADATNSDVTWSSSDESVATVSGGTVTAVGGGSATITVTTDDGGYTATCNVSVTIPVSSVALDKTTAGVVVGETTTLTATVSPADADNQIVAWSSNDESVATVDGGVVSGVAAGTTVIRAASAEDSGLYDECSITVTSSAVSVTGVSLDSSTLSIEKGNNASLAVSLEPADATNSGVTWSSSDESVATVSGGTVTAVGGGSATITVTTDDGGYTATCNVSVTIPVSSVALDKTTAGVVVGETTTLTATVSPADADNQIVAWSSNDESVATVDGGVVSGVAAG